MVLVLITDGQNKCLERGRLGWTFAGVEGD